MTTQRFFFIPNYIPLHGCSNDDITKHFFPIIDLHLRGSCRQTQDWYCVRKRHCEASARTSLLPSVPFLSSRKREKPRHEACCCAEPSLDKSQNTVENILGFKKCCCYFLIFIMSVLNVLCRRCSLSLRKNRRPLNSGRRGVPCVGWRKVFFSARL